MTAALFSITVLVLHTFLVTVPKESLVILLRALHVPCVVGVLSFRPIAVLVRIASFGKAPLQEIWNHFQDQSLKYQQFSVLLYLHEIFNGSTSERRILECRLPISPT